MGEETEDDGGVRKRTDGLSRSGVLGELEAEKQDELDRKKVADTNHTDLAASEPQDPKTGDEHRERNHDPDEDWEVSVPGIVESESKQLGSAVTQFVGEERSRCCQGHLGRANPHFRQMIRRSEGKESDA